MSFLLIIAIIILLVLVYNNKQSKKRKRIAPRVTQYTLPPTTNNNVPSLPSTSISTSTPEQNDDDVLDVEYPERKAPSRQLGMALHYIPESYVLVDLETTGFRPGVNHILEVGCIKIQKGQEVDRFQSLIRPPHSVSKRITKLTGIDNEMVADAPTFEEIAQKLWDFLKDEIIVGHNVRFDINFLYENFLETLNVKFSNDFVDTLPLSRKVYPSFESHKLEDIAEQLKIESEHHRAIADCLIVKDMIDDMTEKIIKSQMSIEIPVYKLENLDVEFVNKYALNLIKSIGSNYDDFESISNFCNELIDKKLATASLCKKMGAVCEKFEDYDGAISFYNAAMDIDPELDFYGKIERLEKKLSEF